jgi:hypothetical protein
VGICIAPTQPYWAALGTESRVCYPGNIAVSQPQWALTYCYLSQSTANQNKKSTHWLCWGWILPPLAHQRTDLTTRPSPTPCEYVCFNTNCKGSNQINTSCLITQQYLLVSIASISLHCLIWANITPTRLTDVWPMLHWKDIYIESARLLDKCLINVTVTLKKTLEFACTVY